VTLEDATALRVAYMIIDSMEVDNHGIKSKSNEIKSLIAESKRGYQFWISGRSSSNVYVMAYWRERIFNEEQQGKNSDG
jgi:hypothetical protein